MARYQVYVGSFSLLNRIDRFLWFLRQNKYRTKIFTNLLREIINAFLKTRLLTAAIMKMNFFRLRFFLCNLFFLNTVVS